jgi:hypothetical protein
LLLPFRVQLPQASRQPPPRQGGAKRRGRAGRGGEDEEEASDAGDDAEAEAASEGEEQAAAAGGDAEAEAMDEEAGEQTEQPRLQRGAAFVAFMPSAMSAVSGSVGVAPGGGSACLCRRVALDML